MNASKLNTDPKPLIKKNFTKAHMRELAQHNPHPNEALLKEKR